MCQDPQPPNLLLQIPAAVSASLSLLLYYLQEGPHICDAAIALQSFRMQKFHHKAADLLQGNPQMVLVTDFAVSDFLLRGR